MSTTLEGTSLQERTISELWGKQPSHLSDIEKTIRINQFLNYEVLINTSVFSEPPHTWFLDLSLYLLFFCTEFHPQILSSDNLKALYSKTIKAYVYTSKLHKSKEVTNAVKKLYIKEYIKVSDMFLSELKASLSLS